MFDGSFETNLDLFIFAMLFICLMGNVQVKMEKLNMYRFLFQIIKVCDFINYLHYIQRGLVKSSAHDVYWEINRLRKEIVLARLGLTKDED